MLGTGIPKNIIYNSIHSRIAEELHSWQLIYNMPLRTSGVNVAVSAGFSQSRPLNVNVWLIYSTNTVFCSLWNEWYHKFISTVCSCSLSWLNSWCSVDVVHDSCGCERITKFIYSNVIAICVGTTDTRVRGLKEQTEQPAVTMSTVLSVLSAWCIQRTGKPYMAQWNEVKGW